MDHGGHAPGLLTDIECDQSNLGGVPQPRTGVQNIDPVYIGVAGKGHHLQSQKVTYWGVMVCNLQVRGVQRKSGSGASAGASMAVEAPFPQGEAWPGA